MQSKDLIYRLQEIGFKEYESKVFLVLLKGADLSASEIATKANIRRTAVYEILKSFTTRGFCNEIETNTILKYEMIDPLVIADKIEKEISQKNKSKIENVKSIFNEFELLNNSEVSDNVNNVNIELIRGFHQHKQAKFIELLKNAKEEILFMIRLEGYVSEELDSRAKEFFKKGGVIKSIYEASLNFKIVKDDTRQNAKLEDLLRICSRFEKSGEKVRISKSEIPNMTIFDRKIVFTNIQDNNVPRHNHADIIIHNEAYASRMIDLFDFYWDKSFKVGEFEVPGVKNSKKTSLKRSTKLNYISS